MRATQDVRAGLIDFWTYHEIQGTPNIGTPPPIPLPPIEPPPQFGADGVTPLVMFMLTQGLQMQMGMQAILGGMGGGGGPLAGGDPNAPDGGGGQPGGTGMGGGMPMAIPPYTDPQTGRTFILDPLSGSVLELRIPQTIVERLQAQQMLGIGLTVSPQGRKASGQEPPKSEQKSDGKGGSRSTTTESRK